MKKILSIVTILLILITSLMTLPLSASAEDAVQEGTVAPATEAPTETVEATEPATEAPTEPLDGNYPKITSITNESAGARVTWDSFDGNKIYRVYYRKAVHYIGTWEEKYGSAGWTRLATVKGNSYLHTAPADAEIGIYTVRAVDDKGDFTSDYNRTGWENSYYAAPVISSISSDDDGVHLKWSQSWEKHGEDNGECYRVYRRTSDTGWTRIASGVRGSYTDTPAPGKVYIYTVRMTDGADDRFLSPHNGGKSVATYVPVTSIENNAKGVKLSWSKFSGASRYRVYYRSNGWTRLATVSGTTYTDTSVKNGTTRVYTVRALNSKDDFISDYRSAGWKHTYYSAPAIKSLSNTVDGVKIAWDRPDGAKDYRVYRKATNGWTRLGQTAGSSFTDTTAVSGKNYTYTIRMIDPETDSFMSDYLSGKSITYVAAPAVKSVENRSDGAMLTWDKVAGADSYRIYYWNGSSWTRLGSKYKPEFLDKTVKNGETREYTLRCLDAKDNFISDYRRNGTVNTYYAPPAIKSVSAASDGVLLEWVRPEGAEDYRVYRKTAGASWTRLGQTDGASFLDTTAEPGVEYLYTIRMVSREDERFMSDYLSGTAFRLLDTPEITSFSNDADGLTVSWNSVKNAASYRLYYRGENGWKSITTTGDTSCIVADAPDSEARLYTLRCIGSDGNFASYFNTAGWTHTYYAPPAFDAITYTDGAYTLRWTNLEGVAAYRVYRRSIAEDSWTRIADAVTDGAFVDDTAAADGIYTYTLRCLDENGGFISYFISDNAYYQGGEVAHGTLSDMGKTYTFIHGQPSVDGYYREDGKLVYYHNGTCVTGDWFNSGTYKGIYNRTQWLYELMCASGEHPSVSVSNGAEVFALARRRGIISTYSSEDYKRSVTRAFAAQTIVKALGYPKRSVGRITDSSDSSLSTVAYYGYFIPDKNDKIYPNAAVTADEFDRILSELQLYKALKGKTLLAFGDSIMFGSGNNDVGIADIIGEKYGMHRFDYSYPGAVMGEYSGKSHIANQVNHAIAANRKPDLILLNGGTNDMFRTSLGYFHSGYDMSSIGESTYTEGFEKTMWKITKQWSGVPVIYIRCHRMVLGTDENERAFGDRGIAVAEKWKAGTIDLYHDSALNTEITSMRDRYTSWDDDRNACDSIHPNALGYAEFYLPEIAKVLGLTYSN